MSELINTFLASKEIKRLIVERTTTANIPIKYLCHEARVDYSRFMQQYINAYSVSDMEIEEWQIKRILKLLGIDLRFTFVVDSKVDMNEIRKDLIDKYALRNRDSNK